MVCTNKGDNNKMREIKFRAWDKIKKKMHHTYAMHNGKAFGSLLFRFKPNMYSDNFKLMQLTGLRDKDGKEIYEGDIVEYYHKYLGLPVTFGVVFFEGGFCQAKKDREPDVWYDWNTLKVIGNIHENPELLANSNQYI